MAAETVVTGGEAVANAVITDIESTVEKDIDEMAVNVESGLQNDDIREYGETVKCMDTSFDSVYEETKLLIDYYEKQKAEEFIEERAEQVIEIMKLFGINSSRITEYSADVLSVVFGFGDMEYFAGIKLFNNVIDRLEVDLDLQRRYEVFDRIYEEGMRKIEQVYSRTLK